MKKKMTNVFKIKKRNKISNGIAEQTLHLQALALNTTLKKHFRIRCIQHGNFQQAFVNTYAFNGQTRWVLKQI